LKYAEGGAKLSHWPGNRVWFSDAPQWRDSMPVNSSANSIANQDSASGVEMRRRRKKSQRLPQHQRTQEKSGRDELRVER
jgi:hypothetical protein